LNSISFKFQKENFKRRHSVYNVHYNPAREAIFVACGHEGVDVYDVSSGSVKFITNIHADTMLFDDGIMNIVDVDCDSTMEFLYILDFERGLLALNIKDIKNIVWHIQY